MNIKYVNYLLRLRNVFTTCIDTAAYILLLCVHVMIPVSGRGRKRRVLLTSKARRVLSKVEWKTRKWPLDGSRVRVAKLLRRLECMPRVRVAQSEGGFTFTFRLRSAGRLAGSWKMEDWNVRSSSLELKGSSARLFQTDGWSRHDTTVPYLLRILTKMDSGSEIRVSSH